MTKYTRISLLFAALELSTGGSVATAQGTSAGKVLNACTVLSAPEIQRIAGRPDLATGKPRSYQETTATYSNCIISGAVDVGITVSKNNNDYYARMRDTYLKVPPKLGYRVEKVRGLGDDVYWLFEPRGANVKLETLVGGRQLSVSLAKFSGVGEMVPEPEAKRIALALATALVPKVR